MTIELFGVLYLEGGQIKGNDGEEKNYFPGCHFFASSILWLCGVPPIVVGLFGSQAQIFDWTGSKRGQIKMACIAWLNIITMQ